MMIPLLPPIDELVESSSIVLFANETGSDFDTEWEDDYDSNDSHLILSIWFDDFFKTISNKEYKNNNLGMTAVIAPIHWTQEEINETVQQEKEREQNFIGGYDANKIGEYDDGKPMYLWQQYKDQWQSELEWCRNHPDYKEKYEGNIACLGVEASPEELSELYTMLLSVPEIKAAFDEFNNACIVKENA